ncbi:MAG: phosphoglucosamine mutase [Myxococcales bacterium]|nr:phosphoglucosamine mutase [Myxococcales bacterium]MCB9537942.1 phosphoglucosamine mutase [Myxococcales bacterium]
MSKDERTLFGTDGVRGLANRHPMTAELAMKLGRAVGYQLREATGRRPKVLIGKDTRLSGYMMETALVSGLCSVGADALLVGPLPTPGIAFLTSGMRADAGLVISASHNPFEDNGIKVFGRDGYKLPDEDELQLERLLVSDELEAFRPTGTEIGRAYRIDDAAGRYAVFAKMAFPRDLTLEGLRVVVDCGNGAGYKVAPEVLRELGAELVPLGVSPDGTNINEDCGALHPEHMVRMVRERRADVGVALDGDADRCILVDARGNVVDGDQVLAIIGTWMLERGELAHDTLVATVMSNIGLDRAIREAGGKVVRVGVGDRYVVERMRQDGLNVGGEQSGHVVLLDHATTGDGLVTALTVLGIMVASKQPLHALAARMTRFPQVLRNVDVPSKPPLESLGPLQAAIADVEGALGDDGRVLVRYSGTQRKCRVMVEGPDDVTIEAMAALLVTALQESLS